MHDGSSGVLALEHYSFSTVFLKLGHKTRQGTPQSTCWPHFFWGNYVWSWYYSWWGLCQLTFVLGSLQSSSSLQLTWGTRICHFVGHTEKNPPKLNNPMISSVRVNIYLTLTLAHWFPFCLYCALELFLWFIFSSINSRAVDLYFWTAKAALVLANGGIMHKLDWGRELYSGLGEHD